MAFRMISDFSSSSMNFVLFKWTGVDSGFSNASLSNSEASSEAPESFFLIFLDVSLLKKLSFLEICDPN